MECQKLKTCLLCVLICSAQAHAANVRQDRAAPGQAPEGVTSPQPQPTGSYGLGLGTGQQHRLRGQQAPYSAPLPSTDAAAVPLPAPIGAGTSMPAWIPGIGWVMVTFMQPPTGLQAATPWPGRWAPPFGNSAAGMPSGPTPIPPGVRTGALAADPTDASPFAEGEEDGIDVMDGGAEPLLSPVELPAGDTAAGAASQTQDPGLSGRQAPGTNATKNAPAAVSSSGPRVQVVPAQPPTDSKAGPSAAPKAPGAKTGTDGKNASSAPTAAGSKSAPISSGTATQRQELRRGPRVALGPRNGVVSGLKPLTPALIKQPGAQKTLLIGCLLQQQVPTDRGFATFEAMKLAVQEMLPSIKPPVNVNLTCFETQCLDITAHYAMERLAHEGAVAVVGPICSSDAVAAAGVAAAAQVPLISPAASSPQLSNRPFFFRTVPSDRVQGTVAAKLARSMGLKSVGLVIEDTAYGQGLSFNFEAAFSAYGGTLADLYSFKGREGDPQAAVATMAKAKSNGNNRLDGVFITANNKSFVADFLRAAHKAKLDVPILSGDALASTELPTLLKDDLGALQRLTLTAFAQGPKELQSKLKAAAAPKTLEPDLGTSAQAYDAVTALLKAYAAAPEPKGGADVAAQIPKQKFQGQTGPVEFDSKGDLVAHDGTYVKATFDTKTGQLQLGGTLPVSN